MIPSAEQRIIPISELRPAEYNPRVELQPGDVEYENIKRSIQRFGFADPVVVNFDMTIIGGHQRVAVAKDLGIVEVPCAVVELDKDDERALNVALNKMSGKWDEEKLGRLLQGLSLGGYDVTLTGYTQEESDTLINGLTLEKNIREDDFDVDSAYERAASNLYVQRGQIYELGNHRLMCGDATSIEDVRRLMNGEEAQCVVTDPPYNMSYEGAGATPKKRSVQNKIINDSMPDAEFEKFLTDAYRVIEEAMSDGASFYVFYKELGRGVFITSLLAAGLTFKQELVWVKNQIVLGGSKYQNMYEPCLFGCKGKSIKSWYGGRKERSVIEDIDLMDEEELRRLIKELIDEPADVIREKKPTKNDLHPTMKPIRLLAKLMKNSSKVRDVVFDGFGGSGSTLIACEQLERCCYMSEYDPIYCQIIIERWEKFTGKKAVLMHD